MKMVRILIVVAFLITPLFAEKVTYSGMNEPINPVKGGVRPWAEPPPAHFRPGGEDIIILMPKKETQPFIDPSYDLLLRLHDHDKQSR